MFVVVEAGGVFLTSLFERNVCISLSSASSLFSSCRRSMEDSSSQVEMMLSYDMKDGDVENEVRHHQDHKSSYKAYVAQRFGRTPRNLCLIAATVVIAFTTGFLTGYLVHRNKGSAAAPLVQIEEPVARETGAAPLMDWDNVTDLLAQKLTTKQFESTFSEFASVDHRAGSPGDEALRGKVLKKFNEYGMNPWTDEYFVRVQDPPASGSNKVVFNGRTYHPKGFLSYSVNGTVTGAVVYAQYGDEADLNQLQDKNNLNIDLSGRVVLVKSGKISFAEKVANAARRNASAVLIFPGSTDGSFGRETQLFGHVHLGSGDPYTPGFPSFNHTQFPPVQSSGLPSIVAQTISINTANDILRQLQGPSSPTQWRDVLRLGGEKDVITVEVNNVLSEKRINNVFGVIKGFVDSDRYVIIGARRDAWGPGFAASTVGTSVLVELARSISHMVKNDGFKPRRSLVFASWSAGEYGNVGATEWLEGYLSSLSMKAFSYIDLDGVVTGQSNFKVAASPLLHTLIGSTIKGVSALNKDANLLSQVAGNWESSVLEPLKLDSAAYPFLAFSGIPSVSFRLTSDELGYQYFGTLLDTREKLNTVTQNSVAQLTRVAAQFAGHIALRLVHDHLLRMDLGRYEKIIRNHVAHINVKVNSIKMMQPQLLPKTLTVQWLISAYSAFNRASRSLTADIQNSDLEDIKMCRSINDRIIMVERNFLSPFVSPRESPFRHVLLGSGPHTLEGLYNHLNAMRNNDPNVDVDAFRDQFALATWTIQGCANSLAAGRWGHPP
ncbi:transferrin receptor protein 1-like isoform X2 [Betta splendens]|uniref:Transferrin receptor protein 1 n=1 Tax=Betta splendens TaxID=158456 RepID=A0A6P7KX61_BETSP|nr:transferrin receptor protein 1-like isoform X2 [Betta splendens]